MWVYFFNYISLPIYRLFIKDKKKYVILVTLQMFIILALRAENLGYDLGNYAVYYGYYKTLSFFKIIKSFNLLGKANLSWYGQESGYVLFNWIIGKMGFSFHSYLVIHAFVCMVSIGVFIYRYSENPALSFSLFLTLGEFEFFFGILRQALGLAVFLWAVPALKERNPKKYFILSILAYLCHSSFMIVVPLYFLANIKIKSVHYIVIFIGSFCLIFLTPFLYNNFISKIFVMFGRTYYSLTYEWNNMFLLMLVFAVFFYFLKGDYLDGTLQWGYLMILPIQAMTFYFSILSRIAMFTFFCFAFVLTANVVEHQKERSNRFLLKFVFYVIGYGFYVYALKNGVTVPYNSIFDKAF